jgi:hypothetical protein
VGKRGWEPQAVPSRWVVWITAVTALALTAVMPFLHHAETRAVVAPAIVLFGVRAMQVQLIRRVTGQISPTEEAYQLGYNAGFEDGRAEGIVDRRTGTDRRVSDFRHRRAGLHAVPPETSSN